MPTLTVYPSMDGYVALDQETDFSTLRGAADGTFVDTTTRDFAEAGIHTPATTNTFSALQRAFVHFDTSVLGAGASISAAVLSLYGSLKNDGLGGFSLHVVASTSASASSLLTADYDQVGGTSFGSVASGSYSTLGYNAITLNASGLAAINKTGITKFAARTSFDLNNSAPAWASEQSSNVYFRTAEWAGTTQDPKLDVTYTTGGISQQQRAGFFRFFG